MSELPDTWQSVVKAEVGHIFLDRHEEGVRFMVMRGPNSLCAYVGVPLSHPLAGHDYDDVPLSCHGGLTFSEKGGGKWPEGWWWYGWDYAHSGDAATYERLRSWGSGDEVQWTPAMVEDDSWSAVWDFKKLVKFAEKCRNTSEAK